MQVGNGGSFSFTVKVSLPGNSISLSDWIGCVDKDDWINDDGVGSVGDGCVVWISDTTTDCIACIVATSSIMQ